MVEGLASKITAWENERGVEFTYDGVRPFTHILMNFTFEILVFLFFFII